MNRRLGIILGKTLDTTPMACSTLSREECQRAMTRRFKLPAISQLVNTLWLDYIRQLQNRITSMRVQVHSRIVAAYLCDILAMIIVVVTLRRRI